MIRTDSENLFFCRELQAAREQLLKLGQDVSSIEATLKLTSSNPAENENNVSAQPVSYLTSGQASNPNPNYSNTRNRSRLAQASANDLDEIKNSSNMVKDSRYALGTNHDYAVGSREKSVGKKRRIESRSDDMAQRVSAYQYHQSPIIRSREAMPPPSLPLRVPRTPKTGFDVQNGRTMDSPLPRFLPSTNVSRKSVFSPNAPNFYSSSYSPICSGKNAPFYLTPNHHESLFAKGRQHHFSPQVSADQTISAAVLPQGFGKQPYLTPLRHDQNGVRSFPRGKQGHPLLNETISPLECTRVGSYVNPYRQNLVDSRELDVTRAEINSSSDTIAGTDPLVRQADSNGGFSKDPTNTNPYYRHGGDPKIPFSTGNMNGGFFSATGLERRLGSRNDRMNINDGELDQNIAHSSSLINSTFKATPTRVSLPPRGSYSIGTPRLRTGMSANARSSSSILIPPTPAAFRPHREPLDKTARSNSYVASPYFSHQSLLRPPQSSPPLVDTSESSGQARTFVEAPFRIDQRSQAGRNPPMYEHLGGRSGFQADPPAHGTGRGDRTSMRRARR